MVGAVEAVAWRRCRSRFIDPSLGDLAVAALVGEVFVVAWFADWRSHSSSSPSTSPHREHRGPASRLTTVVEQRGQRQSDGDSLAKGRRGATTRWAGPDTDVCLRI
jgi:hypothetical protein